MATPLKALLQERLRAKIVRQGDDDEPTNDTATLTATATPLIDPCEYIVPPTRSYDSRGIDERLDRSRDVYRTPRLSRDQNEHDRDYPDRSRFSTSHRQVSPARGYSGSKRPRREERTYGLVDEDAPPVYHPKRPARGSDDERVSRATAQPRKNYDLSRAYQRYRELSHQGRSSRTHTLALRGKARPEDDDVYSFRAGSADLMQRRTPSVVHDDDGYYDRPERPDSLEARYARPSRASSCDPPRIESRRELAYVKSDSTMARLTPPYYERRDVYPADNIPPMYRRIETSVKRRSISPRRPSACSFDPYSGLDPESENRIVFRTAARAGPAPRSPCRPQFLRHESAFDDGVPTIASEPDRYDSELSPESHQAAKDFVEKRQKRTSQGTPRTMATHRWLQSMRPERADSTMPSETPDDVYPTPFKQDEVWTQPDFAVFDVVNPTDARPSYHDVSCNQHPREALLSPVYSPPRYDTTHAFFSSAV